MHIYEYDPTNDYKKLDDVNYCLLTTLQYLWFDLEDDKHGGYAHACGCDVQDVKKDVYELLKHYNCTNSEVLLKAFDDNFNTSDEWDLFYETVNVLFNRWHNKNH